MAGKLRLTRKEATKLINRQIQKGKDLLEKEDSISFESQLNMLSGEYRAWHDYNRQLLGIISDKAGILMPYDKSITHVPPAKTSPTFHDKVERTAGFIASKIRALESIRDRLSFIDETTPTVSKKEIAVGPLGNKVFIVYGHDEAAKQSVARFLEHLDIEPIILDERSIQGRTIIEKLKDESHVHVGYAVVLLTPDDEGRSRQEQVELKPRARQNVILELGYFVGFLGRARVCPLLVEGVETPSDYHGVGYITFDKAGGWKLKLANELKAAGFDIDINKLK